MPPPYRQPSQVGATAATKRPFKPPAISKSGTSSVSSTSAAPRLAGPATASSSRTGAATATRPQPWSNNPTSGFQSAGAHIDKSDLEALLIDDSDEDEDGDDFADNAAATTTTTTTVEPPSKRQRTLPSLPARLPSLSPMSSAAHQNPAPQPQNPAAAIGGPQDDIPLLPSALITRLLHESFDDKNVKIGKDANALTARYLDLFVREAVARATEVAKERKEMKEAAGQGEHEVWLEMQDLEEIAPGLVLDF